MLHALRCFRKYWLWLILLFLALFLIMMLPFAGDQWRGVEGDVSTRVTQALNGANHTWAKVETYDRGRDVLISGVAPSIEDKETIMALAKGVSDKRGNKVASSVEWAGTIAPPVKLTAPNFSMEISSSLIALRGELSSQAEIDRLIYTAKSQYVESRVLSYLKVGEQLKKVENLDQLVVGLDEGKLGVNFLGDKVVLTGEVPDEKTKRVMARVYQSRLPEGYEVQNNLTVLKPMPAELPVDTQQVRVLPEKLQVCQDELTSLMNTSTILFASSQAIIKTESYPVLDQIAEVLGRCDDATVLITGHTDSSGNKQSNVILSNNRAQAVVDYLGSHGISQSKLSARGLGSATPVADNATVEGRAKNRRIEFTIK